MPDDTPPPSSLDAPEWINHWIDQSLPPDPIDAIAWRYAVGCTTAISMSRLMPVLEYLGTAVSTYRLSPLDMLLIGNMLTEATQNKWNRWIAPNKRQHLFQIYSATKDVAEDLVETFRENGFPPNYPKPEPD
jgi:hypothetical protein